MLTVHHLLLLLVFISNVFLSVSSISWSYTARSHAREHCSISSSPSSAFQSHTHLIRAYISVQFQKRRVTSCYLSKQLDFRADHNHNAYARETSNSHSSTIAVVSAQIIPTANLSTPEISRRAVLIHSLAFLILSLGIPESSLASEIDTTGQLFTPKNVMIKGGGSTSARGIRLKPVEEKASKNRRNESLLNKSGLIQNVYETRFIAYLARFLLVFDPSANAWWRKNSNISAQYESENDMDTIINNDVTKERFAEFAESVEIGLGEDDVL